MKKCTSSHRIRYNFAAFRMLHAQVWNLVLFLFSERSTTIYSCFVLLLLKNEKFSKSKACIYPTFRHFNSDHSIKFFILTRYPVILCSHVESNDSVSGQSWSKSDCVDAQADLGCRCPHIIEAITKTRLFKYTENFTTEKG